MSFLALAGYLIAWVRRFMRRKRVIVATPSALPEWPRGASLEIDMHDFRFFSDAGGTEQPEMLSIILRRDEVTGRIYDEADNELVSVTVRGHGPMQVRRDPQDILRALSTEILAGHMMTFLFADKSFGVSADVTGRMGLKFVDATCAWVHGFAERAPDSECVAA